MKDAVDAVARNNELRWDVRLSPNVPLSIEIGASLTVDQFDFTELTLNRLSMDGGTGHTVVRLPARAMSADVEGGVGVLDLHIPDESKITLGLDAGAGATNIFAGDAALKANIDGGVGNCTITVPDTAASARPRG